MTAQTKLRRMSDRELDALADRIADPRYRGQCPPEYARLVAREMHKRQEALRA